MRTFFVLFYLLYFASCNTNSLKYWNPYTKSSLLQTVKVRLGEESHAILILSEGEIVYAQEDEEPQKVTNRLVIRPQKNTHLKFSSKTFVYKTRKYRGELLLLSTENNSVLLVNKVHLEDYLLSVVPSEMPASWHIEALKAQAVCARSYAVNAILQNSNKPFHLRDDVYDQAYYGMAKEHENSTKAVKETEDIIILYNDKPASAFYHSNSGGMTEEAENIWGMKIPYTHSVVSNFDYFATNFAWEYPISFTTLNSAFSTYPVGDIQDITIQKVTNAGRVVSLDIQGTKKTISLRGTEFRKLLGYEKVRSLKYYVRKTETGFTINGYGYGHGVGLSQWGSYGMAKTNYNYMQILNHYYKDIELGKIMFSR
jgi:stage II sporulation protein D